MAKKKIISLISLIITTFLIIFTIFPFFRYCGMLAWVQPNKSIAIIIGFPIILAIIFYVCSILYSLINIIPPFNKKNIYKINIQSIILFISIIIFISTLIIAREMAKDIAYCLANFPN